MVPIINKESEEWRGEQMLKSLFISAAGMLPKMHQLEVISNNLANINSHGFKKQSVFERHLKNAQNAALNMLGAEDNSMSPDEVYTDFSQGTLENTGNPLDFAIVGPGFFVVQGEDGQYLTRNGHFQLDNYGRLIDENGNAVVTSGGELYLQNNQFEIDESGKIYVDGQVIAQIEIRQVQNPASLERVGQNYFKASSDTVFVENEPMSYQVKQGMLESSNVDPLQEMVQMIELYRTFELAQKNIQTEDNNLNKIINQAGRLR